MSLISEQFQNPMLAASILKASRENKEQHCDSVWSAFDKNPPAGVQFPPLISFYHSCVLAFKVKKQDVNTGTKLAATQTVNEVKVDFKKTATFLDKKVKSTYEGKTSVYKAFFPKSLTVTKASKKGDIAEVIENWRAKAVAPETALDADTVTRITELQEAWVTAVSNQGGSTNKLKTARVLIDPAWTALAWAEYALMLAMASANPQNPLLLDAYFDMSMFGSKTNPDTDGVATLTGSVKHSVTGEFIAQALFTFTHIGTGKTYQFKTNSEGLFTKHNLMLGLYTFTVSAGGYMSFTGQANLLDAQNIPLDVTLLQLGEPG